MSGQVQHQCGYSWRASPETNCLPAKADVLLPSLQSEDHLPVNRTLSDDSKSLEHKSLVFETIHLPVQQIQTNHQRNQSSNSVAVAIPGGTEMKCHRG